MAQVILYLTRLIVIIALPLFVVFLILKETEVWNTTWLIVFTPIIVASIMFIVCVMFIWLTFVLAHFE